MPLTTPLGQLLRQTPLGSILDTWPRETLFYDGLSRRTSRSTHRLFQLWSQVSHGEAEAGFQAYNGGDFLDVGAFHGFFSFCLAPKAKPNDWFISFEPDRQVFSQLLSNLAEATTLFPDIKFSSLPIAVSDGSPVLSVNVGESLHPSFRSSSTTAPENLETSTSLDAVVSQFKLKPTLIKIDVEGAEFSVLEGARETLKKFQPNLLLELHPSFLPSGVTVESIRDLLGQLSYEQTILINQDERTQRTLWVPQ